MSLPLCILYNKSLPSGVFSNRWKTGRIVPIYKYGDTSHCKKFRPISILPCFAKIFESLVYDRLYRYSKPLLSSKQLGFVKGRSTVTNLLEYKQYLCQIFSVDGQDGSIYTDFSKAFEKIRDQLFCRKLASCGIHGNWMTLMI